MNWKETKELIKSDLSRLGKINKFFGVKYLLCNASFRITFWLRIGSYLKTKKGILFKLLYILVLIIHKHNQYLTGIQLGLGSSIKGGLTFNHFSCIVINGNAKIGKNCTIYQGVTIGGMKGPKGGIPVIGDNVVIFAGAKVIGNVKVGNNVVIGAGAVVINDIPDNSIVAGVPAKIISENGPEVIKYYI